MEAWEIHRNSNRGMFETDPSYLPNRPASAQGRFVNTTTGGKGKLGNAPLGFNAEFGVGSKDSHKNNDMFMNPAVAQALAALGVAGNLSPQQLQQIQMQVAITAARNGNLSINTNDITAMSNSNHGNMIHSAHVGNSIKKTRTPNGVSSAIPHSSGSIMRGSRDYTYGHGPTPSSGSAAGGSKRHHHHHEGRSPDSASPTAQSDVVRSLLLEEFRNNKNRKFELQVHTVMF
jgi:hypothetical protein